MTKPNEQQEEEQEMDILDKFAAADGLTREEEAQKLGKIIEAQAAYGWVKVHRKTGSDRVELGTNWRILDKYGSTVASLLRESDVDLILSLRDRLAAEVQKREEAERNLATFDTDLGHAWTIIRGHEAKITELGQIAQAARVAEGEAMIVLEGTEAHAKRLETKLAATQEALASLIVVTRSNLQDGGYDKEDVLAYCRDAAALLPSTQPGESVT